MESKKSALVFVARILSAGSSLAHSPSSGKKINVEYVSVNPNGPITVGSGRGAAFGSCLANVLEAAGNEVHREYYINDGVNSEQMRLFAESVKALVEGKLIPENGDKGDYVAAVAEDLKGSVGSDLSVISTAAIGWFQSKSQEIMLDKQRLDLATFSQQSAPLYPGRGFFLTSSDNLIHSCQFL